MKKILAFLTACTMLLGVTANALPGYSTLETVKTFDYYSNTHMAVNPEITTLKNLQSNGNGTSFPVDTTVYDGKLFLGMTHTATYGSITPSFALNFADNDKGTGKTTLSFSPYNLGGWLGDNGGTIYLRFYSGTTKLFELRTASRGWDMRVTSGGGTNTATPSNNRLSQNQGTFCNATTKGNVNIILDHDTNTVSFLTNNATYDTMSTPYTFSTDVLKGKPITKIDAVYNIGSTTGGVLIDDMKVVHTSADDVETVLFEENFEDSTKKLARDFGIADGLNYVYRGDNYMGFVNDGTDGGIFLEQSLTDFPTEGLVVVEFSANQYDAEGNNVPWYGLYYTPSGNDLPMFAIGNRTAQATYTKLAGFAPYNNGTREQAEFVNFYGTQFDSNTNGVKSETTVPAGTQWDVVNDFKVLLDMDAKTYNVYYKDATDTYVQFNKDADIPFAVADDYTVNRMWFGSSANPDAKQFEISDVSIYTVEKLAPPVVYVAEVGDAQFETFAEALAAAEDGDTLKLLEDVTLEEAIKIENDITLDLAGKKLTTFALNSNYDVTVKGNVVIDDKVGGGSVDVKGTYGIGVGTTGALTVNAGTFNHVAETSDYLIGSWGTTVINGGTFNGVYNAVNGFQGTVTINGGSFTSTIYEDEGCVVLGNTTINGGTFSEDVSDYCADGFKAEANGDGTFGIVEFDAVAEVGGVEYESLADAIAAANAGATVTLLADAAGAGAKIDKDITIDFGGFTYEFTEGVGSGTLTSNGFQILAGNDVTLKNGTLKVADADKAEFYTLIQNYANLDIVDMTLDGTNLDKWSATDGDSYVVSNNSGTVNITGATNIIANDEGDKAFAFDACKYGNYDAPVVNVSTTGKIDGKIEATAEINITSGTYTVALDEAWCADGFIPADNGDGTYGVVEGEYVAAIGEAKYTSFAEAYEAAVAGDTITLLADVNANALLALDKAITLDLNNFAYTSTAAKAIEVYADATIKNGTVTGKDRAVDTRVAVTLNLENVALTVTGSGNTQPLTVGGSENGTVINVTDSTITANKIGYGIITFVESDINIVNSDVTGYAALYFKAGSANSVATVDADSTLTAYSNPGYLFGAIVLEDDNITVTVDGAINADEVAEGAINAAVVLNGNVNTVALNGTVTADQIIDSYVDGATITTTNAAVAEALEAEGYVVADPVDGVYAVTGVAKVLDVTATSVKVAGLDGACTLILATYSNDQFVAIKAIPLTADVEMTLAEAGLNTAGADTVKAFLWNGLTTMVPVAGYTADSAAL